MAALPVERTPHLSLVEKFATKFSIDSGKLLPILKATCFKQEENKEVSNEQMAALLVVADQYGLNPFTRELFAFADKNRGIVPILSIDGWARIINERPELDGIEFVDGPPKPQDGKTVPEWIECVIYRKDRAHPIRVRERFAECRRGTGPWGTHPSRMLRHKALIQCARVAFGFAGIYDQDEAEQIIERDITPQPQRDPAAPAQTRTAAVVEKARRVRAAERAPIEGEAQQQDGGEPAGEARQQPEANDAAQHGGIPPAEASLDTVLRYIDEAKTAEQADLALDLARDLPPEEFAKAKARRDERFPVKE